MDLLKIFRRDPPTQKRTGIGSGWSWPISPFASQTKSGTPVSASSALSYSPIFGGIDLISGDMAKIPVDSFRRDGDDVMRATRHPSHKLLTKWTGEMSSSLWMASMISNAILYGNAFSKINRNSIGEATSLEFLPSVQVRIRRVYGEDNAKVLHVTRHEADLEILTEAQVFWLPGLTFSNLGGLPLIHYAMNMIGRMLSAEGYGDDFFRNLGVPDGYITHPEQLSPEAKQRLIHAMEDRHGSNGKRHRLGLLDEGMGWTQTGLSAEDMMLVSMLEFGVHEAARFLKIPPHKLGSDSRTSYNSVAEENRAYFNSTLGSWVAKFEAEANIKLFPDTQWDRYFVKFEVDKIFQATLKERMEANAIAVNNGILSRNEVRIDEGRNPYDGGDEFLMPLNMTTTDDAPQEEPATNDQPVAEPDDRCDLEEVLARAGDVLAKAICVSIRRTCNQLANSVRKKPEAYLSTVNELYVSSREKFCDDVREAMWLVISINEGRWDSRRLEDMVSKHVFESLIRLAEDEVPMTPERVRGLIPTLEEFGAQAARVVIENKHEVLT